METPIQIFEIDSQTRIAVYQDYHPYKMEHLCGNGFGVQTLNIARNLSEISSDDEVKETVRRVRDSIHYYNYNDYEDKRERVLGAWLSAKGYAFDFVTLRGYSQGEWADVVVYTPIQNAEYLKYQIEDLQNWFRGDVFVLTKENLETYVNVHDDSNEIKRWEYADSIGGVLGDSNELLFEKAKEYFG